MRAGSWRWSSARPAASCRDAGGGRSSSRLGSTPGGGDASAVVRDGPGPGLVDEGVPAEAEGEGQREELEQGLERLPFGAGLELGEDDQGQDEGEGEGRQGRIEIAAAEAADPPGPDLPEPGQSRPGEHA